MSEAFFDGEPGGADTGGWSVRQFGAGAACAGPWRPDAMHGGPPSALLVRAAEEVTRAAGGHDLVALRAGVDFLAPVPLGPVQVRARVVRAGRRITLAESELLSAGKVVLAARTWLLRAVAPPGSGASPAADGVDPAPQASPAAPEACPPTMTAWTFPYARAIEWRHVSGDPLGPGDAAAWARPRIPLVAGETPSGLQRAVLVADSGNGISAALDWGRWSFVNVDLTVHLSRDLTGDWVLLDARTRYEPGGTGLATSVLHDVHGVVGTGAQTLLVSPLPQG